MHEVRIHGRGGQGAVTTGQLLAIAAFHDGLESQTFPMFGVERAGAPVQAFCRINQKPIHIRSQIYHPDIVLVLDASLLETIDVTAGLASGGLIIINSDKTPKQLKIPSKFEAYTVDATTIALEIFGRPIVNTPILGALSAVKKIVNLNSIHKAIDEKFAGSKGKKIADLNKKAINEVYKRLK